MLLYGKNINPEIRKIPNKSPPELSTYYKISVSGKLNNVSNILHINAVTCRINSLCYTQNVSKVIQWRFIY